MQLPASFIQNMEPVLGKAQATLFLQALESEQPVSIRLNSRKHPLGMTNENGHIVRIPWCTTGLYLKERLTFTFDPLFHAGGYYVQEASSMFLEQIIRQYIKEPVTLLDLCAAPGGKSTLARETIPEGSLLVANEVIPTRAPILVENLQKWGHPDVIVTSNLPAELGTLTHTFDVIITDVPCSGEGMFRKDPVAVSEWSPENVALCERRQREILRDIWPALKPGGLLIYSTCTYNLHEDEYQIDWIARELGAEVLPVEIDPEWGITGNLAQKEFPVYRFLPHRTRGEGLFMAALRKKGEESLPHPSRKSHKKRAKEERKDQKKKSFFSIQQAPYTPLPHWLEGDPERWHFSLCGEGTCHAIHREHTLLASRMREAGLRILSAGIPLARQKGKDLIPHPALALSQILCKEAFPYATLSYDQAITYLRRESIALPEDTPHGYILVTYRSLPLGFVKNIGNRSNNLYPSEWRIRSSYLPEQIRILEQLSLEG